MSYLRGPLSRSQIKSLMDPRRQEFAGAAQKSSSSSSSSSSSRPPAAPDNEDAGFLPPRSAKVETASGSAIRPRLPDEASEYFNSAAGSHYAPAMLRSATVIYRDAKKKIDGRVTVTVVNEIDTAGAKVNWDKFLDLPRDLDPASLDSEPADGATFADLPSAAQKSATWKAIAKDFTDWVYANHQAELRFSPLLGAYSDFGETEADFRIRVSQLARELRDQAVEDLRAKMAKQVKSIEDKRARAQQKVDTQKSQASTAKWSTAAAIGGTLLGAFFGRKRGLVTSTNVRSVGSAVRESQDVAAAEQEVERCNQELKALEQQLADETQKIRDQYDPTALAFETAKLTPLKKNITTSAVGILWIGK
jgi:hypothetical protein